MCVTTFSDSKGLLRGAGRKDIKLVAVKVAGEARTADSYEMTEKKLTLSGLPKGAFELEIETEIKPQVWQILRTGLSCLCMRGQAVQRLCIQLECIAMSCYLTG